MGGKKGQAINNSFLDSEHIANHACQIISVALRKKKCNFAQYQEKVL